MVATGVAGACFQGRPDTDDFNCIIWVKREIKLSREFHNGVQISYW